MLKSLSGRPNYVTTGVAIVCIDKNVRITKAATAAVFFSSYDKTAIEAYVATGDPFDKAGGYAIQHPLCREMIEKIEGDQDIIVGFPTKVTASLLKQCGIETRSLSNEELHEALR